MILPFARDQRLELAPKVRLRHDRLSGQDVLLYPERGLALNAVASTIVRLCDGTRTLSQLVSELCARYPDVSEAELESDLQAFLGELATRGLLAGARDDG